MGMDTGSSWFFDEESRHLRTVCGVFIFALRHKNCSESQFMSCTVFSLISSEATTFNSTRMKVETAKGKGKQKKNFLDNDVSQ